MEAVLALVSEDVDGAEGFQCDSDLLLGLAVVHEDNTTEDAKTILGCILVQLQLLTGGGNS